MISTSTKTAGDRAQKLTGRSYLSYSAISLYQACPLRWYFKYVAGLPEKTVSASLVFGGAIHRSVEFHFQELLAGEPAPDLDMLLAEYAAAWRNVDPALVTFGKDDDLSTLGSLADRMLRAFQASDFAKPTGTIIGVEEEFRGQLVPGCPDLLGRIDLLIETDDAVLITDLKTSRSRWTRDQVDDSSAQLLLYSELVRPLVPGKRIKLQFAVVTKAKQPALDLHELPVDPKRLARTKRIVERVWRAIESGTFYPSPSPMQCPTCPFRGPCRRWTG